MKQVIFQSQEPMKSNNIRKLGWIGLSSLLLSGATVLTAEDGKAKSEGDVLTGRATIDVRKTVNPAVIGGGVNFAFSDFNYINFRSGGEWGDIHSQHLPCPDDKKEWASFMRLMDYAGFQYVRLGVGVTQWEPVNDDSDPNHLNLQSGFVFSPGFAAAHPEVDANNRIYMDLMYRLLDHWDQRRMFVVLGNWWAGPDTFCPKGDNWLLMHDKDGKQLSHMDRTTLNVANLEEFTESLAAIMVHLKRNKGYHCVKGISFMNEPEQMTDYCATLARVYKSLGAQLRRHGVRDDVSIQSFDGAIFWTREEGSVSNGVARLLRVADADIDIISVHDYHSIFEYQKKAGLPEAHGTILDNAVGKILSPALEQIREADSDRQIEPVVFGEFGTCALTRGDTRVDPANDTRYEQRLCCAESLIQLLNHGAKAVAFWVYNNNHHAYWRMLTFDPADRRHFVPEPANFYPLALAMKYIVSGSDIVSSRVDGCVDAQGHPRVFLAAARKANDITLLWVNDSDSPARVEVAGLPAGKPLRHHRVTATTHDRIVFVGERAANEATVNLMPRSIEVLTTYTYGSERVDPQ